ncbi:hypothetical protein PR202_ga21822 [Eleusine coracana subsp. coracana]|uniref:Lactate/malate dehydrogenase C-terminal domain-containing protein n=1 Tax=Eleusine coracana subsp. coracana TaxID=191504 RepID=A0AAV5D1F7_ELECO|nr:hypothetical protein PR202_ga21822 [Eleusine coracana subsp. coracana]
MEPQDEKPKSWKKMVSIAVSGAAGMISNHLLFKLASGEVFGPDQPIALRLLGSERSFEALEGSPVFLFLATTCVAMELEDSLYPLLREVSIGIDPYEVFEDVDWALLIGAKPRGHGMERAALLDINGQIFTEQRKTSEEVIKDSKCVEVCSSKNGAGSSAASTAVSIVDAIKSLIIPTPEGDWFSSGVYTNGNPYGIAEDIVFSMPCRSKGDGDYELAADVVMDDFLWERIKKTEAELVAEKKCVAHLTGEGVAFCELVREDTWIPGEM